MKITTCSPKELPPQKALLEMFNYDPITGILIWKTRSQDSFVSRGTMLTWNTRYAGNVAGSKRRNANGKRWRVAICLKGGNTVSAHRIIWQLVHGSCPVNMYIDHINGDPWDNRLENLRLATPSQNQFNTHGRRPGYSVKGASFHSRFKRWASCIRLNGRLKSLGYFSTKGGAASAYARASLRYHGKFSVYYKAA